MESKRRLRIFFHKDGNENDTYNRRYYNYGYSFTSNLNAYVQNIQGLGFSLEDESVRVGNTFSATKKDVAQGSISFDIYFKTYREYNDFCKNIVWAKNTMVLEYTIDLSNTSVFFKKVLFQSMSKAEKVNGFLVCKVVTKDLTHWYKTTSSQSIVVGTAWSTITYTNDSDFPVDIVFSCGGKRFKNFEMLVVGDEFTKKLQVNKEFTGSNYLIYSSKDNNYYIKEDQYDSYMHLGEIDIFNSDYVDALNENIIQIPPKQNVTLSFRVEESNSPTLTLKLNAYYLTV